MVTFSHFLDVLEENIEIPLDNLIPETIKKGNYVKTVQSTECSTTVICKCQTTIQLVVDYTSA